MANLSNHLPSSIFQDEPEYRYRAAEASEYEEAIRLMLTRPHLAPDMGWVAEYARLARVHREHAGGLRIALCNDQIISGVLPITSAGRTMLLMVPLFVAGPMQMTATRGLVNQTCELAKADGIKIAQCLVDPDHLAAMQLLENAGFKKIADLMYLQLTPSLTPRKPPVLPEGFGWKSYEPSTHELFARGILGSYEESLDCPTMKGLRSIEDIIAGHRATGQHDPKLWHVVIDPAGAPVGVLLLSKIHNGAALELVYVGIVPGQRGKGIGDALMRKAMEAMAETHAQKLTLAVDAINTPALNLYWRHGMKQAGKKTALMRII